MREFYCKNCGTIFSEFEQTNNEYDNGICPSCGEYCIVNLSFWRQLMERVLIAIDRRIKWKKYQR